jgi:hypothetical protein
MKSQMQGIPKILMKHIVALAIFDNNFLQYQGTQRDLEAYKA